MVDIVNLDKVRKKTKATKKALKHLKVFDLGDLLKCNIDEARVLLEKNFPGHIILEVLDNGDNQLLIKGPKLNCVLSTRSKE
tara:strand:- start:555 stop:800 length:246 start_codon:yes stop_codon:yes gene_type:complete